MSEKRKTEDTRGLALGYIAEYLEKRLGFYRSDFVEWFSMEKDGKSEKTLRRYIRGDTAMKDWSFEQFWDKVESTVQQYLEFEDLGRPLAPHAAKTWEAEKVTQEALCRLFFLDWGDPDRAEDFPDKAQQLFDTGDRYKRLFLDTVKPVFEALDKDTAYSLQANFPAFATVTAADIAFWGDILGMTEEEKETQRAAMLQGATVDAGTMLANLQSAEVRCWVNLGSVNYSDTARNAKGLWERFSEKFMALWPWQFPMTAWFLITPLLVAYAGVDPAAGKFEADLPTKEDIDLLLLFKYCLAPEERERFVKF